MIRAKIDINYANWAAGDYKWFVLYRYEGMKGFWSPREIWKYLGAFDTRQEAKDAWEKIKDLPEYL